MGLTVGAGSSNIWGGKMTRDEVESFRDYNPLTTSPFEIKGWDKLNIGEKLMLANPCTFWAGTKAIAYTHRHDAKDVSEMRFGPAGYGPGHQNYEEKDSGLKTVAKALIGPLGAGLGGLLFTQG